MKSSCVQIGVCPCGRPAYMQISRLTGPGPNDRTPERPICDQCLKKEGDEMVARAEREKQERLKQREQRFRAAIKERARQFCVDTFESFTEQNVETINNAMIIGAQMYENQVYNVTKEIH